MKNLVSKAPRSSENAIFNARKIFYNKSVFARFCYLYVNLLNFELFLHNSQIFFFQKKKRKEKKNRILLKTRKITCLFIANKYLHQLPWVDCANVEPSQKKKKFYIRMYLILNLSCFVLSLDSSACLGNNFLPEILQLHTLPPKKYDQKVISMLEQRHIFTNI